VQSVAYFCLKVLYYPSSVNILSSPIEYLKGVGPQRADLLKKELGIFTFDDLLNHFPFRHVDKTKVNLVKEITPLTEYIQVAGVLMNFEVIGQRTGKRLVAQLKDKTGFLELTWFQGHQLDPKNITTGAILFSVWKSFILQWRAADHSS
jgi:ATP-dependent DNA helicase RecG